VSGGALFAFEDVVVDRDGVLALNGFTAVVPNTGITAVFGPSGSGKSTMLRLCDRLEVATAGRVLYRGLDVTELDPLQLRRQVGMCMQRPTPFPGTVADNLLVADPQADESKMQEALEQVSLQGSWLDRDATALSGGEAQRMCLARTLITQPDVLLLDEPTSAVDVTAARTIESAVRELADASLAVLWVSHDPAQVHRIADHILEVDHGRCVGGGPIMRDDPRSGGVGL